MPAARYLINSSGSGIETSQRVFGGVRAPDGFRGASDSLGSSSEVSATSPFQPADFAIDLPQDAEFAHAEVPHFFFHKNPWWLY